MSSNKSYEIERKFLIKKLPEQLNNYSHSIIEQGYLCINPVVRVRRINNDYILTYKSSGMMTREEYEHPLTADGYQHLIQKSDGIVISKTRYYIPDDTGHIIELDIFDKDLDGFIMAEVEFSSEEDAVNYIIPDWFDREVTHDSAFHNSRISRMNKADLESFLNML